MTARAALPLSVLVVVATSVWCLSVAFLIWPVPLANAAMRIALVGVAVAATVLALRRSKRLCMLSPPYLLGILVLVFYGLGPSIYLQIFPVLPDFFSGGGAEGHVATEAFVGSRGELLVLQFAAMCFAVAALALRYAPEPEPLLLPGGTFRKLGMIWAPALALILAALNLLARESDAVAGIFASGASAPMKGAMAPVMSLCLATTACVAGSAGPRYVLGAVGVIMTALVAMVVSDGLAFTPVRIAIAALLLIVIMRGARGARLTQLPLIVAGVVVASITLSALSGPALPQYAHRTLAFIEAKLVSKLVHRQGVPGYCLDRIVNRFAGTENTGPFYFLYAVVPRVVWPEKPNLSRGNEFAVKYCGQGNADPRHSESITLLGEPILSAGVTGLIVAELVLVAVLGGAAFIGLPGGPVRLIVLTAMLPWLVTFEEHFAQYVALVAKMFLIMLPFVAVLAWAARSPGREGARKPA